MAEPTVEAVVLGAGGHARVLVDLLRREGRLTPVGALVRDAALAGGDLLGVPILGDDDALAGFDPARVVLVNGVGSTRSMTARRDVFLRCRDLGFRFATLIHPNAIVAEGVSLAEGTQVLAGAIVNTGARLGENSIVNTGAVVEHDCRLGAHVHVATGAILAGAVTVEDEVHVGAGATVIQGVTIGRGSVVGAGAAVIHDVGAATVAVGVPARARGGSR
jgi:sugar O-acyltransferase (sialic acid O-acetyltransferase NeuD family)